MPSASISTSLRSALRLVGLHVAVAFPVSKLLDAVEMQFPFEVSSMSLWALTIIAAVIYASAILKIVPYFELPSVDLLRRIPRHEGFDDLTSILIGIVQKQCPNSFLLEENPIRMWALIACICIYKFTGDIITGSLASAILMSFSAHPDKVPAVFIIWATVVVICVLFHI